jgi:nitrogen fixation/metabolism regulation signal transduction histidine kinase
VADGDYTVRILTRPGDDLGVLVVSFNRMVNELDRARRRMAQAEKVQAWQEIAQRLAHEVKNPLTPIKLTAERLQRRYEVGAADFPDVLHRAVDTIRREVDALTEMLDEFRSFSRMPEPQFYPISIEHVFAEAAAVYHDFPGVDIDLSGIASNLEIDADRGQIRRVVLNLFANAVEAADGRVRIVVSAHEIQREGVPTCRIRIDDDGPGIPPELGESLFKPYVTSKSSGTGLGLAIVERIVFDHEGGISYESAPGSGTTFVVDLPLHHPPETRRPAS